MRRIGEPINLTVDDLQSANRIAAFAQGLAELGWSVARILQFDYRWAVSMAGTDISTSGRR
jgi:hypothetical protein